jgi:DNA replicative helicase MCM subunit Mcm2 (Cdc46/Mcm family)
MSNECNEDDIDEAFNILEDMLIAMTTDGEGPIDLDALCTYKSKTTRGIHENIIETIKEYDSGPGASKEDVANELLRIGITTYNDHLSRLKEEGLIFEPRKDYWKVMP